MTAGSYKRENKWLSVHIFYKYDLNLLLTKLVAPILERWYDNKLVSGHFFIRYWEEGQHIRLRVKTNRLSKEDAVKELSELYETNFSSSESYDHAFKISFAEYVQELARYGGVHSIELAEKVFEYSSINTIKLLRYYSREWDYSKAISVALQTHLLFIKGIGENLQGAIQLLDFLLYNNMPHAVKETTRENFKQEAEKSKELFEQSYFQQKTSIDYLCHSIWKSDNWETSDWRFDWTETVRKIDKELNSLHLLELLEEPEWLNELIAPNTISNEMLHKWAIWASYFHMTNNRLGIYLRDESFIYYALKNGLLSIAN